ncbi:hypothetical protein C8R41DRAFT_926178 [Lentinula lateritia]|uniref:Uncharacterized protein n=1 Tax=Lentinula lateritia TaxID=40482 RepID=A0ABQ8V1A7_9AGAR|nr:hypothetical protein C8R41DRAFT_926178 [Lentinula lateritia]
MLSSIVFLASYVTLSTLSSASPVPSFDSASSPSSGSNSTLIISGPFSSIPIVSRGNEQSTPGDRTTKKHRDNRNHRKKGIRWPQDIAYVNQLLRQGHEIFGYSFVPVDVEVPSLSDLQIPALQSTFQGSTGRLEHLFRVPPYSIRGCRSCIIVSQPSVRQRLKTQYGMVFHLIPPYNPSTSIEFSETDQRFDFVDNTQDHTVMYLPQPAIDEEKQNFHIACYHIGRNSGPPSTWIGANWAGWGIENWQDWDYNRQLPPQYTE